MKAAKKTLRHLAVYRVELSVALLAFATLAVLALYLPAWAESARFGQRIDPFPQCSDGVDNDDDGLTDYPDDPDCNDPNDITESQPECSDGKDNDNDGSIDYPDDEGCEGSLDNNEHEEPAPDEAEEREPTPTMTQNEPTNPTTSVSEETPHPAEQKEEQPSETPSPDQPAEQVAQTPPNALTTVAAIFTPQKLVLAAGAATTLLLLSRQLFSFKQRCRKCKDPRYSMHAPGLHRLTCICCRNKHYPHRQTAKKKR